MHGKERLGLGMMHTMGQSGVSYVTRESRAGMQGWLPLAQGSQGPWPRAWATQGPWVAQAAQLHSVVLVEYSTLPRKRPKATICRPLLQGIVLFQGCCPTTLVLFTCHVPKYDTCNMRDWTPIFLLGLVRAFLQLSFVGTL
jgi:hypothetical protein